VGTAARRRAGLQERGVRQRRGVYVRLLIATPFFVIGGLLMILAEKIAGGRP
jgi:hypothetical protein